MKILRKLFAVGIIAVLLLSFFTGSVGAALESEFSGTRTVVFTADSSDIENFISGGRSALDLMLRGSAPEWADCSLRTVGRDLELKLSFAFTTYDDYTAKTSELLTKAASVLYNAEDGLFLLESHEAPELLTFLAAPMNAQGALSERTLDGIFKVTQNALTLRGEEYLFDDKVNLRPEGMTAQLFDYLRVETECDNDGEYKRVITAEPQYSGEHELTAVRDDFEKVGTLTVDEYDESRLTVEFSAANDKELVNKTMQCLKSAVAVTESEVFIDDRTVGVTREEFFDLDSMMTEHGRFEYLYKLPGFYAAFSVLTEGVSVQEGGIYSDNTGLISCYYERGFRFDRVDVKTDFSDILGSVTRTISFVSRSDLAVSCHETVKTALSEKLTDGVTLNIYDKSGNRYYEFVLKAWYMSDIDEFTQSVLDGSYADISDSFLPFGTSTVKEKVSAEDVLDGTLPPKEVTVTYKFSDKNDHEMLTRRLDRTTLPDGSVQYSVGNGKTLELEYRRVNLLKLLLDVVILAVIAIAAVAVVKALLKVRGQRPGLTPAAGPDSQPETVEQPQSRPAAPAGTVQFCPTCGSRLSPGDRFCEVCGTKTEN